MDSKGRITDRIATRLVRGRDIIRWDCVYKCKDRSDNVWASMWWILPSTGNKVKEENTIKDEIKHIEWISANRQCGNKIIRYETKVAITYSWSIGKDATWEIAKEVIITEEEIIRE